MTKQQSSPDQLIGDKTLQQWDRQWVTVPGGFAVPHPEFIGQAGLYRATFNGEIFVIGKAAGKWPNRLAQRLGAFRTTGDGGRKHQSGRFIHANRDVLQLEVLVVGSDTASCKITNKLLRPMLARHKPVKNAPLDLVAAQALRRSESHAQ